MMKFFIVDAFTDKPFGGNTAGVVLLDDGCDFPNDVFMLQLAAEFRYSETAFVKRHSENEFTVRYFTPKGEVDLCGHATIAAFVAMTTQGIVPDGMLCINHTLAGDLKVITGAKVMMEMSRPTVLPLVVDKERLSEIIGVDVDDVPLPVEVVSTGLPDIIMGTGSVSQLNALIPDMEALTQLSQELGVTGVHAFAFDDDGYTAHVRNFSPLYGIPEESATGTANAALTYYLCRHGVISMPSECCFIQGEAMSRPSLVSTSLHSDGTVWVGGKSSIVARGIIAV